eukprot:5563971-Pyramimonas_sp.AAC.1
MAYRTPAEWKPGQPVEYAKLMYVDSVDYQPFDSMMALWEDGTKRSVPQCTAAMFENLQGVPLTLESALESA